MDIGITTSLADWSVSPTEVARVVEDAGLELLCFGEHTHIPAARETPYPGSRDGVLPAGYERNLDLFVTLTMAAVATKTLHVGTGILQMVQRDPIVTAKAIASVDHISGGRMIPITGSSWNVEEMRNHGTDPQTRYELLEERVLAMREIWSQDEASFHGRFVDFDRIWSWPKPVQRPMPIYIGGNSPGVEERALRAGAGWAPGHGPDTPARVEAFLAGARERGIETSVIAVGGPLAPDTIESYTRAGARYWLSGVPIAGSDDLGTYERAVEAIAAVRAEFAGTP